MNSRGFTIMELMIVVAIIGVLAAIAWPNYTSYMNKGRRADGITALLQLQQAQTRLRANCRFYAPILVDDNNDGVNDSDCLAIGTTELEFDTTSPEGFYTLRMGDPVDDAAFYVATSGNAYLAVAEAIAGGKQASDTNCKKLVLTVTGSNPDGVRSSRDSTGAASTGCW